ncbi:hypothetical protein ACPF7Z_13695 [Halomonas sp. GXIMD04776]|uniref:hypothetical protein n=1 Tax=Halomonas sp. GXIMD04776 TaxID=3415605 RepID=UPI003CC04F89
MLQVETETQMSIYDSMIELRDTSIKSKQHAEEFLNRHPIEKQKALLSIVLLGRAHLDHQKLRDDVPISTEMVAQVPLEEYPDKIYAIRNSVEKYINQIMFCAHNSNFNLDNIEIT